jgi:hypothetical protein
MVEIFVQLENGRQMNLSIFEIVQIQLHFCEIHSQFELMMFDEPDDFYDDELKIFIIELKMYLIVLNSRGIHKKIIGSVKVLEHESKICAIHVVQLNQEICVKVVDND